MFYVKIKNLIICSFLTMIVWKISPVKINRIYFVPDFMPAVVGEPMYRKPSKHDSLDLGSKTKQKTVNKTRWRISPKLIQKKIFKTNEKSYNKKVK